MTCPYLDNAWAYWVDLYLYQLVSTSSFKWCVDPFPAITITLKIFTTPKITSILTPIFDIFDDISTWGRRIDQIYIAFDSSRQDASFEVPCQKGKSWPKMSTIDAMPQRRTSSTHVVDGCWTCPQSISMIYSSFYSARWALSYALSYSSIRCLVYEKFSGP